VGRRLLLLAAALAVALPAASLAATITGTNRADHLRGTPRADSLFGRGGDDLIEGLGGNDLLDGGPGRDTLVGGPGDDRFAAGYDGARDVVRCGPGKDLVNTDLVDQVASDCEVAVRRLSRDVFQNSDSQHETEAEPASFAFRRTIVAAFQSGRFADGAASSIGFAASSNEGRTWRSGFLPGLTGLSSPQGPAARVSDPTVAYDAEHGVWLIGSLAIAPDRWQMLVSRSPDGTSWSLPTAAAVASPGTLDKGWLACDNWPSSRFRGQCYLSYLDAASNRIAMRTSSDGGLTWSAPTSTPAVSPVDVNGAQPLVRPDGTLAVVYASFSNRTFEESEVLAVRSTDGGTSFSEPVRVAVLQSAGLADLRSPPLPSATVDGAGRLYAVWEDCRFSSGCSRNDLVLAASDDSVTWSDPVRVPTTAAASGVHSLVPGLAADPATAAGTARLALVYYTLPLDCSARPACAGVDAQTISSTDGAATWSRPERLDAEPMKLNWIAADVQEGHMLGDYESVSFVGGRAVPIVALAVAPAGPGRFRQAIYARTR
jgi:BNR repeat-like domain/RTX calcium-binding nonapeptide repeat (4 copies)